MHGVKCSKTLRVNISETGLVLLINEQGEKAKEGDEGEFSGCCSCSWGSAVAERSGGERSEPQRSGAPVPTEVVPAASHPNPEVVARPQRRSYTAEYKVRILREAEAAAAIRGGIGALLRREGLYSSLLVNWRRERAQGIREALTPQKRGPKSKRHPLADEMQKLERQNARLNEELRKAHIIIDVQKKVAAPIRRVSFAP